MSKKVNKLNQLKNPESFIQTHTIKGFKYIDKAGEIVNIYHKNNSIPKFTMNLDGLVIEEPLEKVKTLKITPTFFWIKFSEVDTLDNVARVFSEELEKVSSILDFTKLNRVGWRNYFVYEFRNEKESKAFIEKMKFFSSTELEIAKLKLETGKSFGASLLFQLVARADDRNQKGVLFDLDVFETGEFEINEIATKLREFREYMQDSKGFLETLNDILG